MDSAYLRARYYDPSIGRFITKDTYEGEITNPLTMNLYVYTANNPLRYIDPSGHCFTEKLGKKYCKAAWIITKVAVSDAWDSSKNFAINTLKDLDKFLYKTYGPESDSYKFYNSMTD
ncbi:RHS repeat-associated core domain-containing protein [Paenibacillus sp. TAF43_2]